MTSSKVWEFKNGQMDLFFKVSLKKEKEKEGENIFYIQKHFIKEIGVKEN